MQHIHCWKTHTYLQLGLPVDGMADRLMIWTCLCGVWACITGEVRLGTEIHTPEWWDALVRQEAARGTLEGRVARREQQKRIR